MGRFGGSRECGICTVLTHTPMPLHLFNSAYLILACNLPLIPIEIGHVQVNSCSSLAVKQQTPYRCMIKPYDRLNSSNILSRILPLHYAPAQPAWCALSSTPPCDPLGDAIFRALSSSSNMIGSRTGIDHVI